MSSDAVVELMRAAWLTLAFMMLLSRLVFQAAGAVRMRAFLDAWQGGAVKRAWGCAALRPLPGAQGCPCQSPYSAPLLP